MSSVRPAGALSSPTKLGRCPQGRRGHVAVHRDRLTPRPSATSPASLGRKGVRRLWPPLRHCPRPAPLPESALLAFSGSRCCARVALSRCDGKNAMNRSVIVAGRCNRHVVRWLLATAALLATATAALAQGTEPPSADPRTVSY